MKAIILVGVLSLLSINTFAAGSSSFAGSYNCDRSDASGNKMPLNVSVTGDTLTFQWTNTNGYPVMYGTGVMTKGMDNVTSVVFWDAKDKNNYGNEVFVLKSDGTLSGTYTMQSDNKITSEACTKS